MTIYEGYYFRAVDQGNELSSFKEHMEHVFKRGVLLYSERLPANQKSGLWITLDVPEYPSRLHFSRHLY